MLLTVTEDLDYPLEVLLLEVIFLIKDYLASHPKKPNSTCWMEILLMTEELHQIFQAKVGRIEIFFVFLMLCFFRNFMYI